MAGLLALIAVVSLVIGIVSVSALNHQVLSQVDRQLTSASQRSINAPNPQFLGEHNGGDLAGGPGGVQGPGTLGAQITSGQITQAKIVQNDGQLTSLSAAALKTLAAVPEDNKPHTISLAGFGQYRILATPHADGDGTVILTGLPLNDANSTVTNLTLVILIVSLIGLLGAAIAGRVIVRLALRPLKRVADTATRVSKLQLDRGEVALQDRVPEADTDTRTEVGQVGSALNSMLGHVATALSARQASEMRVRQFVADASHELRTPLAAIRGYAELTRRTGDDLPGDITYAMDRVESEATRMTGLVEDLLLLARLDTGRPIDMEAVDLTALVIDAVSDAHAAGPDHPVRLALPDEPVEIIGDPARLHQVLTNLLTNARTHTAPGTRISVTLRQPSREAVVVEIADEGPGIAPDLLPHIFERFARADTSRSRKAGSTGLGLAIVSAVVSAHGGSVEVQTRPGRTVFAVTLPTFVTAPDSGTGAGPDIETGPQTAGKPQRVGS